MTPEPIWTTYVWRTGMIETRRRKSVPAGAMGLFAFMGRRAALVGKDAIAAKARHAYDGETLLVPGVPEADDAEAALDALIAWEQRVLPCLARRIPAGRWNRIEEPVR